MTSEKTYGTRLWHIIANRRNSAAVTAVFYSSYRGKITDLPDMLLFKTAAHH